jgi:hypothetical protein
MTAPSMSAELVRCRHCGRRNRVPPAAAGIPALIVLRRDQVAAVEAAIGP